MFARTQTPTAAQSNDLSCAVAAERSAAAHSSFGMASHPSTASHAALHALQLAPSPKYPLLHSQLASESKVSVAVCVAAGSQTVTSVHSRLAVAEPGADCHSPDEY